MRRGRSRPAFWRPALRFPASSLAALVLVSELLGGCSGATVGVEGFDPELFAWPPEDPRVRLVRVVARRRDADRRGLRSWIGSDKNAPLFRRPYGVAWAGDDLLVSDPGAGVVLRLTAGRKILRSPEGLFAGPIGVAACPQGVVVTDSQSGRVALLDDRLHLVRWLAEGLVRPTGVACHGGGVYVVETGEHRLLRLVAEGYEVVAGGRGEELGHFNFPTALTADGDELWLGDTLNFRVLRLAAATGEILGSFGALGDALGETPRIKDVAIDAAGHVWVSDAHLDGVAIFDREGTFLMSLGRTGQGPGELSFPAGVAAHPDGRVAVADSINRRLQIFTVIEPPATEPAAGENR